MLQHWAKSNELIALGSGRDRRAYGRRRGSVLILVVGVLVLLVISATVYVGVGRLERLSASAQESTVLRSATVDKVIDHIGHILAIDLFGNDPSASKPFEDKAGVVADSPIYPERWDNPYTRPRSSGPFDFLADPWLASTEPVDNDGDGRPETWRHISNIHPEGRFVDLDRIFRSRQGFYASDLFINKEPYQLDTTREGTEPSDPLKFDVQIDELDDTTTGFVTFADRRYGDDTDADGRIDARWTELVDVTGMSQGMRTFVAVRIIDASAMVNLNANFELGLAVPQDTSENPGYGRTPSDVDAYSFLLESYDELAGRIFGLEMPESTFAEFGFEEHLRRLGILQEYDIGFSPGNRIDHMIRDELYERFGHRPYVLYDKMRFYDARDEMELRTTWATSNDRTASRLEQSFDRLNAPGGPRLSPFRNLFPNELNYAEDRPELFHTPGRPGIMDDVRHLLTTYNGSRSMQSWNLADLPGGLVNSHGIKRKPSINTLLGVGSDLAIDLQPVMDAFMWALAPYAVDHRRNPSAPRNIYNLEAFWQPPSGVEYNYGDGDAGFAYLRSAMMAVNARDYVDDDDESPTIRKLSFDTLRRTDPLTDLGGSLAHGDITITNPPVDEWMLIGLERQPFLMEAATFQIYFDSDVFDGVFEINLNKPLVGPSDIYARAVAFEIGNPWDTPIRLGQYEIRVIGENVPTIIYDLGTLSGGSSTLDAGETAVLYVSSLDPSADPNGLGAWISAIGSRGGGPSDIRRLGGDATSINLQSEHDTITLWYKNAEYGARRVTVLVDRLEPETSNSSLFPNLLTNVFNYSGTGFPPVEGYFLVKSGSMRRYSARAAGNTDTGFPGYVFQSPRSIDRNGRSAASGGMLAPLLRDPPVGTVRSDVISDQLNDLSGTKGYPPGSFVFAPFQFHVDNIAGNTGPGSVGYGEIRSPVDLLMITSATHLKFNGDASFGNHNDYVTISEYLGDEFLDLGVRFGPTVGRIARGQGYAAGAAGMPDFRLTGLGTGAADVGNPFVGKLDYTRYIPRQGTSTLPFEAVPLAARVIDAFEATPTAESGRLVQGRININTAPLDVLRLLPYLYPRKVVEDLVIRPNDPANDLKLAAGLLAYRDLRQTRQGGLEWNKGRAETSGLHVQMGNRSSDGLRDDRARFAGFISLGELPLVGQWDAVRTYHRPIAPRDESMARFGQDGVNLDYTRLDPSPYTELSHNPVDDVAEQLALVRAISNCVSVRSDVFVAYISLASFTPGDIENARQLAKRTGFSELEVLKATRDQKYVVVLDRSNVNRPTDRPRILFVKQLVPVN